ncbi:MAG TPA: DUF4142 domain-containing protein [Gemmatimonadaceae bacterium]
MLTSQKNVLDRMIVSDSVEIEMSVLATQRTKNPSVRELASSLIADHRQDLDSLRKLAELPEIGRATIKGDPTRAQDARVVAQLRGLSADSAFDRAYVAEQVERHQRAIDNLKKWRDSAESVLVHLAIGRALPVVEQHLERAKAVAAQLK